MKSIIIFSCFLSLASCGIYDRHIIKSILSDRDSTIICDKERIGRKLPESFQIPASLRYDKKDRLCYLVIKNSNYAIQDFKFSPKEFKNAKVYSDTIFDKNNVLESIETLLLIVSKKRNKTIGIDMRGDKTIKMVYETEGIKMMPHPKLDIMEFDEKGFFIKRYKERLE